MYYMDSRYLVVLSGTPGSGKDTITECLARLDSVSIHGTEWTFVACKKDKMVTNIQKASDEPRNAFYHLVDAETFSRKIKDGAYIQYHQRYQSGYAVSLQSLQGAWESHQIPVVHNGKLENLTSFTREGISPFFVLLTCAQKATEQRLMARQSSKPDEWNKRMAAYHEERQELAGSLLSGDALSCHVALSTDQMPALTVAHILRSSSAIYWSNLVE